MHVSAAAPIGIAPRGRWLGRLAAFLFFAFAFLEAAGPADARSFREMRLADAARTIGTSEPGQRMDDMSPCTVQPAYPAGSLGDLFSRPGLLGGFAAGFLGAGVLGLLFGHGLIGELSGLPSVLGLIFQVALLLAFGWLIWGWWRADKAALGGLSPRQLADAYGHARKETPPADGPETIRAGSDSEQNLSDAR